MSRVPSKIVFATKSPVAKKKLSKSKGKKNSAWTATKNIRRCGLIDKEIDGTLTLAESKELELLQNEMLAFRRRVAPLPMEEARKLHADLMRKAGMLPE